jgi:hypothetical protein
MSAPQTSPWKQRCSGKEGSRAGAPQFEIEAPRDRLQKRDPLLMVDRHRADERDFDIRRRKGIENPRLEREVAHFNPDAGGSEHLYDPRQLRDHQVVDGPVLAARRLDSDLPDRNRLADALDAPHELRIDMEEVLVEHEVESELLDLREQDVLGLCVEPGTQSDLAGDRPQHRLERCYDGLQPCRRRLPFGNIRHFRRVGRHSVLARPGRLNPGIVDVDFRGGVTQRHEVLRIKIADAEQARVSGGHLFRIRGVSKSRLATISQSRKRG